MKYRIPEGCSSLTLNGEVVEIVDGVVEVNGHHEFLTSNGFTPVLDDAPKKVTDGDGAKAKPLEKINKEELLAVAAKLKVEVNESMTKPQIIEAINSKTVDGDGE